MTKLNQVIAVFPDRKDAGQKALTQAHRQTQAIPPTGLIREYVPLSDGDETLPSETNLVQLNVSQILDDLKDPITRMLDVARTRDQGNTIAKATVYLNGAPFLEDVPTTHLLYLEKFVSDFHTFVQGLPTLDPSKEWARDPNDATLYRSRPTRTIRSRKDVVPIVKYDATPEHPAQTELITKDVPVGTWVTTHLSGAIPADQKRSLLNRTNELKDAVRVAREQANSTPVTPLSEGEQILDYLLEGITPTQTQTSTPSKKPPKPPK